MAGGWQHRSGRSNLNALASVTEREYPPPSEFFDQTGLAHCNLLKVEIREVLFLPSTL